MKKIFKRYTQGEVVKLGEKLSPKNKKILDEFLDKCRITAGDSKVKDIKRIMLQFYDITEKGFDKQTKNSVNAFLVVLRESDKSIFTKNTIKSYVKKFLKWYYKDLEMVENIKRETCAVASKINENNLITEKDIEKMLRYAESFKEKAYLFMLFELGCRPEEILNLKWKDIKFEDDYADVSLFSNKTKKSRTFPIKKSKKYLWEWKQNYSFPDVTPNDFIFVSRWRGKRITTNGANKILRRMSAKAGLNKDVWNYLFRHTRATRLYEELPTPIVEQLLGHKNMSRVYAHISSKKTREAMLNKIYNIEELSEGEKEELKKIKAELEIIKKAVGNLISGGEKNNLSEDDKLAIIKQLK